MDMRLLQVLPKGAERLLCIGFTRKGRAAEFLEGYNFLGTLFEPRIVDHALGSVTAALGGDYPSALRHASIVQRQYAIAIAFDE
jgi:hypothetical protein